MNAPPLTSGHIALALAEGMCPSCLGRLTEGGPSQRQGRTGYCGPCQTGWYSKDEAFASAMRPSGDTLYGPGGASMTGRNLLYAWRA